MSKPVNNLEVCALFVPETFDGDTFTYTELLDRNKKSGNNKGRLVRTFWHRTRADLVEQMPAIISMCEYTGARAYIRLTPRSFRQVGMVFAKMVLDQALTGNWEGMRHGYNRACGTTSKKEGRVWLFDVDHLEDTDVTRTITARPEFVAVVPSRKGRHLITRPFDLRGLELGEIQVHKDNPTNLFIPGS